jgi:methyl-accepting chemotaxis protein
MIWFHHLRISHKLFIVFSVICLFMGGIGYIGVTVISQLNEDIESLYEDRFVRVIQLMEINKAVSENTLALMNAATLNQSVTELEKTLSNNMTKAEENLQAYSQHQLSREEENLLGSLTTLMLGYKSNVKDSIELVKQQDKMALAIKVSGSSAQKKAIEDTLMSLVSIHNEESKRLFESSGQTVQQSLYLTLSLIGAGILLSVSLGFLLSRMIAGPIRQVKAKLAEISQAGGDLTGRLAVPSRDEVGQLASEFNSMMDSIQRIIKEVLHHAELVARTSSELSSKASQTQAASNEISFAVKGIAAGADTQVESITETSVSMNQMSAGIQQISANAQEVNAASVETTELARQGKEVMEQSMAKIEAVTLTVNRSADMVKKLGKRSQEIGKIVDTITTIASQTNLLALNAAIEAARAAEHGRGFAVVADEVRKLAEESGLAAKQIAGMIQEIQQETTKVAEQMVSGAVEVEEGLRVSQVAKDSFQQIYEAIERMSKQVIEVSAATEQMAAGTEDVLQSVQTIVLIAESATDETTKVYATVEDTSNSMNEIVAASNGLTTMAGDLQKLVGQFKV